MDHYLVRAAANPHPIKARVPGSKSITNRALLIGALAEGTTRLSGILFSDDSRHFLLALKDLGFTVFWDEEACTAEILGLGGRLPDAETSGERLPDAETASRRLPDAETAGISSKLPLPHERRIDVGSAGTAARFLTAYLGLSNGRCRIDSSEQMKKRPMKELLDALRDLGAEVSFYEEEDHFPLCIGNPDLSEGFSGNEVTVDVDRSSQFLSALLISSVLFKDGLTIHVTGNHGMAYVEMTVAMMAHFGVKAERFSQDGYTANYRIPAGSAYRAMDYAIEPDVSAACYFYAMGLVLSVPAKVQGVHFECLQGDIRFLQVLQDMGASFTEEVEGVEMTPPAGKPKGGSWNLAAFSDQALTLAAIAPFAASPVRIEGIGHIRYQECDRIQAILGNLGALGIDCREESGTVMIQPSGVLKPASIETYKDHRVAMSFTVTGLKYGGVDILDPMCCRKTFETYYQVLEQAVY